MLLVSLFWIHTNSKTEKQIYEEHIIMYTGVLRLFGDLRLNNIHVLLRIFYRIVCCGLIVKTFSINMALTKTEYEV